MHFLSFHNLLVFASFGGRTITDLSMAFPSMPRYFLLQNQLHWCLGQFMWGFLAHLLTGGVCDTRVIVHASSNPQFPKI